MTIARKKKCTESPSVINAESSQLPNGGVVDCHQGLNLSNLPPTKEPSPKEIDSLIAQEMNELSMKERDKVLFDIHGISDASEETNEFLDTSLARLEAELSRIGQKEAYNMAKALSPDYVSNRKFRLMFLRCDRFDAKRAAIRLVKHFESKLELFGADKVARDIVQEDLDEDDLRCLQAPFLQLLPSRDRAGRAVLCWVPKVAPAGVALRNKVR